MYEALRLDDLMYSDYRLNEKKTSQIHLCFCFASFQLYIDLSVGVYCQFVRSI